MVIGLHAAALLLFMSGDRIAVSHTPQTVMLQAVLPPAIAEPAPPPPPPRPRRRKAPRLARAAAAPRHDAETAPRTEVVPAIVDNAIPVEPAGGKPEGSASGAGDAGAGVGGGAPVRVRAVINPDNCERPRLPWAAEQRQLAGDVILAVLIDVDGKVTDARVMRSSGQPMLDQAALKGARKCHFVAATVDKVPVRSWEPFRFSWVNR